MTDAEAAVEEAADADPDAADHDGAEDPPEIPEDQQADLPADLAADAEAAAGAGSDAEDPQGSEADEQETEDSDGGESADSGRTTEAAGDTYGDLYARTLVNVTNAAIEEHGQEGAEKTDLEAARQLNIPDHADRLVEELGLGSEMPPGQALVASSAVFVLVNLSAKTDLPAEVLGDLDL
jgi:hypothetical protein